MTAVLFAKAMGETLYHEWQAVDFDLSLFPTLAYRSVISSKPADAMKVFDIPRSLLTGGDIPPQRVNQGSLFGQPALTLYVAEDRRFLIELYLWSSVDMTIHDHPFSGAFAVLEGECQHDVFLFERSGGTPQLQTGTLTLTKTERLLPGDGRMIVNGSRLIHRNLHLSKPTVTFIIRTYRDPGLTGMIYDESGLAVAPDLSVVEQKYLDYLDGVLQLHQHHKALQMVQAVMASGFSDYAKFFSAQSYLDYTWRYHEVDLIAEMLSFSVPEVPAECFKKTFLLHQTRLLERAELFSTDAPGRS